MALATSWMPEGGEEELSIKLLVLYWTVVCMFFVYLYIYLNKVCVIVDWAESIVLKWFLTFLNLGILLGL